MYGHLLHIRYYTLHPPGLLSSSLLPFYLTDFTSPPPSLSLFLSLPLSLSLSLSLSPLSLLSSITHTVSSQYCIIITASTINPRQYSTPTISWYKSIINSNNIASLVYLHSIPGWLKLYCDISRKCRTTWSHSYHSDISYAPITRERGKGETTIDWINENGIRLKGEREGGRGNEYSITKNSRTDIQH